MSHFQKHKELYEQLVHSNAERLYRFAVRMCGQQETAEDLIQETYYEAWKSIHSLRDPSRGRAWLYQILKHCYARWLRKEKTTPQQGIPFSSLEQVLESPAVDPAEYFIQHQTMQKALDSLDEIYKEPFLLVYLAGFTCQETANLLELPLGTVLSRIHRARLFLRQFLTPDYPNYTHLNSQNSEPDSKQIQMPES